MKSVGILTFRILLLAWFQVLLFADDMDILVGRFRQNFYNSATTPSVQEAQDLMATLKTDGTWPDIDYENTNGKDWDPSSHLDRLALLAKAYVDTEFTLAGNAGLASKFSQALNAWIRINPISSKWWWNEIGSGLRITPSIYLMRDKLTTSQIVGTDSLLARSWKSTHRTGANLVWISKITMWRACLNMNEPLLKEAVTAIAANIAITTSEGIQPDYSFHQHGAQIYSGGYGTSFLNDCVSTAKNLQGTQYQFPQDRGEILANMLLEGDRWMIRGTIIDHSVRGREIARSRTGSAGSIANSAISLSASVPGSAKELAAMGATIKSKVGSSVEGARYFWRSEYLSQQRPGYFISVRMASSRMRASENISEEGKLSQYLADGTTLFYRSGREYDVIFPVWDWCRIPGTTVAYTDSIPPLDEVHLGTGDFAGGVADGKFGAATFDYDKLGVKARKAWFHFDREMVALGAGVTSTVSAPINTTVNQCLLNGAVIAATGMVAAPTLKIMAPGGTLPTGVQWIHHDSIGYIFPVNGTKVALSTGTVSGSWTRISSTDSPDKIDKDVFNLWIDHGKSPTDATYQYIALMGVTVAEASTYAANLDVQVLSNTKSLQAVRQATLGITEAVFYAAGTLNVTTSISLSPDRACILLVREEAGKLVVGISDPRRGTTDLKVKAKGKLTGTNAVWSATDNSTSLTFALPKGDSAGATRLQSFGNGTGIQPFNKSIKGLSLSAHRVGFSNGSAINIDYRVPGPGRIALSLEDIRGRTLATLFHGQVEAGKHLWSSAGKPNGIANALGSGRVFVHMEWEDRVIIIPLGN